MTNYLRLTTFSLAFASALISCTDPEPTGPEGALGKQFNTAINQVTSSLAYSIMVSADGSKIFVTTTSTGGYLYSADGGKTFNPADNYYLNRAKFIDNLGNILTDDRRVINGSTMNMVNSYDQLILGDNGKIFSYSETIKYSDITGSSFTDIESPSTPTGGTSVYVMKAPGKGLLYVEATSSSAKAWFLDESTLEWSSPVTVSFDSTPLNHGCNNLNAFVKFAYAGNNILVVKGCTGSALIDLTNSNTTSITYPSSDTEHLIYEDIRDGQLFLDSKKQVYMVAATYEDLSRTKNIYRYNGTSWSRIEGNYSLNQTGVFAADLAGNIYYNSSDGAGGSIRGAVKLNVTSNEKSGLALPTEKLNISDAAALSNNKLLIIVENVLYEHDITANTTTLGSLSGVTYINTLSDGRLLVGGGDKLYLSSDEGNTWAEHKNIFSSVDPDKTGAVSQSRILNGKIMLIGTYAYYYDNLSTGVRQEKYDNVAVEFDGSKSTKLQYTFPGDFRPSSIGTDGTIYGSSILYFDWQITSLPYEIKANSQPTELEAFSGLPQVITDGGLQMAILPMQSGDLEVKTRNSSTEEWKSANTPLPKIDYGNVTLRLSGDRLVVINNSQVYVSGN